ncbi:MAG TPA: energy transducer TonB [Polyangia bacterium]|nr:energy transducer TonB [Polyangia bacterium]
MAFESFRARDSDRSRRQRRLAFFLVAVFHGVLIAAGVAYSYWHVEELMPPTLRVTFMSAPPPPPPPPPPPAGGGARPRKVAVRPKTPEPVPEKPPEIVQPPEKVKPKKYERRKYTDEYEEKDDAKAGTGVGKGKIGQEDGEEDGEEGGVAGGQKHGIIGGSIGGTGATPAPPRSMPAQFGALQKTSGSEPEFPPSLRRGDMVYVVEAQICVSTTGSVDTVKLTKTSDRLLDENVVKAVRGWRFRPMRFNNTIVGFCYPARFEFKSEH